MFIVLHVPAPLQRLQTPSKRMTGRVSDAKTRDATVVGSAKASLAAILVSCDVEVVVENNKDDVRMSVVKDALNVFVAILGTITPKAATPTKRFVIIVIMATSNTIRIDAAVMVSCSRVAFGRDDDDA